MGRRAWTRAEEAAAVELRRAGLKVAAVARRLGRTFQAVRTKLHRLGVADDDTRRPRRGRGRLSRIVVQLLRRGECVRDVAERLGVCPSVVTAIRKRKGLPASSAADARRRSWEWRRAADPARVAELTAAGWSKPRIAAELGCSAATVGNVRRELRRGAGQTGTTAQSASGGRAADSCAASTASSHEG